MTPDEAKELRRIVNSGALDDDPGLKQKAMEKLMMAEAKPQSGWIGTPQLGLDEETRAGIETGKKARELGRRNQTEATRREEAVTPRSTGLLGDPTTPSGLEAIGSKFESLPSTKLPPLRAAEPDALRIAKEMAAQGNSPKHALMLAYLEKGMSKDDAVSTYASDMGVSSADARDVLAQSLSMLPDARKQIQAIPNLSKSHEFPIETKYTSSKGLEPWQLAMPLMGVLHEEWQEPSLEEFQRDMGDYLFKHQGLDASKLSENSIYYKRYADARWMQALGQAQAEDRSIRRTALIKPPSLGSTVDKAVGYGHDILMRGMGEVLRADQSMTFGLGTELNAEAAGMFPGAPDSIQNRNAMRGLRSAQGTAGGEIAGALAPWGATQKLASTVAHMIPGVRGISGLGFNTELNLLRSGTIGALTGAGEQLGKDVVENVSDFTSGQPLSVPTDQLGPRALGSGLMGGLFGVGGGVLETGAIGLKKNLLSTESQGGRHLRAMEDQGIERGLRGTIQSPKARAVEDELLSSGESLEGSMSRRLTQPMAKEAYNLQEAGMRGEKPLLMRQIEKYQETFDKSSSSHKQSVAPLADQVIEIVEKRHFDKDGVEMPGVFNVKDLEAFRNRLFETKEIPQGQSFAYPAESGWRELPIDKPGFRVIGRPRKVSPRELDEIMEALDARARFTEPGGGAPKEKAWRELNIALRKVRDGFPANRWTKDPATGRQYTAELPDGTTVSGYSALKQRLSDAERQTEEFNTSVGLPEKLELRTGIGEKLKQYEVKKVNLGEVDSYKTRGWSVAKEPGTDEIVKTVRGRDYLRGKRDAREGKEPGELGDGYFDGYFGNETWTGLDGGQLIKSTDGRWYTRTPGQKMQRVDNASARHWLKRNNLTTHGSDQKTFSPWGDREVTMTRLRERKKKPRTVAEQLQPKTAGELDVDLDEPAKRMFEQALQSLKQEKGKDRNYANIIKLAGMVSDEAKDELLTKAAMIAAQRLGGKGGEVGMGVTPGAGPYPRIGGLSGEGLGLRLSSLANTVKARPSAQEAPPSAGLRKLLRLMGRSENPVGIEPIGPRPFSVFGLGSGGGGVYGLGQEDPTGPRLTPELQAMVGGGPVDGKPMPLPPREQTTYDNLVRKLADYLVEKVQKKEELK